MFKLIVKVQADIQGSSRYPAGSWLCFLLWAWWGHNICTLFHLNSVFVKHVDHLHTLLILSQTRGESQEWSAQIYSMQYGHEQHKCAFKWYFRMLTVLYVIWEMICLYVAGTENNLKSQPRTVLSGLHQINSYMLLGFQGKRKWFKYKITIYRWYTIGKKITYMI